MRLAVITPTRNRPLGIELLTEMMLAQTLTPDLWVIVDAGEEQAPILDSLPGGGVVARLLNPHPPTVTGPQSLLDNIALGIEFAREHEVDAIAVMEDDDYYAPNYLLTATRFLEKAALYGEAGALYYNVQTRRWRQMQNHSHASLCSTAWNEEFGGGIVDDAIAEVRTGPRNAFLDIAIWKHAHDRDALVTLRAPNPRQVVAIKGLPGTKGIGVGHDARFPNFDEDGSKLRELVPDPFAGRYLALYQHARTGEDYGR